jgi:hypothetical protein
VESATLGIVLPAPELEIATAETPGTCEDGPS